MGSNISPNMTYNIGQSMSQNMASNMPTLGPSNDPYMTMAWPMSVPMMNHDWQKNVEPNMPYWSPEMDGPNGIPKRLLRFENPINKIGESSFNNNMMKSNWMQHQMFNKRQVFCQKQINEPDFRTVANNFGQSREILNNKRTVFNSNNEQTFKGNWRQPEPNNAVEHSFGHMNNSVDDFELSNPQKQQNCFSSANGRYLNGKLFPQSDDNYYGVPKNCSQQLSFPNMDMKKLTKSMQNISTSESFLTPQKSDIFHNYSTNSKSAENLFFKDSRTVQMKTPNKVQVFPSTGTSFTKINTATPSEMFTDVREKISPQKRHISENENSENKKNHETSDLRHFIIAKRRKLDCNDTRPKSANSVEGKFVLIPFTLTL